MKKIAILSLAFLLFFFACQKAPPAAAEAESPPAATESTAQTAVAAYGESLLTVDELALYQLLKNEAEAYRTDTVLPLDPPLSSERVKSVCHALRSDWPLLYWLQFDYTDTPGVYVSEITLRAKAPYTVESVQREHTEIGTVADALLDNIDKSAPAVERIAAIHDVLLRHIAYREQSSQPSDSTPYGGLVRGAGICDAYSRSFQLLAQRCGVSCFYISGTSMRRVPHSWNMVFISGNWYYVDTTWDDVPDEKGYLYHDYLLSTPQEFALQHFTDAEYTNLPQVWADRFNYYRYFGYCADLSQTGQSPIEAMAAGFVRQLEDASLTSLSQPVYLEIKLLGEYGDFCSYRSIYLDQIFELLREIDRQLKEKNSNISIDTTGYVEYNSNDNTQVLTLIPSASVAVSVENASQPLPHSS